MKKTTTPLVVANWKMNPKSLADAKTLFVAVRKKVGNQRNVTVVVAPPSIYLSDLARLSPSGRIGIGAQSIWPEPTGAHTGEVSAPMVVSAGATYIIIGHSERRAEGVDDDGVRARVRAALRSKVTPIVCVGESSRDDGGEFYSVLEDQLTAALGGLKKAEVARTVIAYEPIWAIGSGTTPSAEDIQETRLFIDKCLTKLTDRATAQKVIILYGGSVKETSAGELYRAGGVDGFLVGGASLKPDSFAGIVNAVRPE